MFFSPELKALIGKDLSPFTFKRYLKLPFRAYLGWIKTSVDLREPTPCPLCLESHVKPGFYDVEFVH